MRWAEAERLAPAIHARWTRVIASRNCEHFGSSYQQPTWDRLDPYQRVQITAWVIAAAEHLEATWIGTRA